MFEFSLDEVGDIIGRKIKGAAEDVVVRRVSIDSRTVSAGDLFVGLKGARRDGAAFARDALRKGAVASIISHDSLKDEEDGGRIIRVKNTCAALQDIARANRKKFGGKLIGITGSNGKTTVKEMVASILSEEGAVIKTESNMNNHIGVPLTLLKIDGKSEFAVVEMGMNHRGEIGLLSRLAEPDIAVVLNVLRAHAGNFTDLRDIAEAKLEIAEGLKKEGTMVLNADDRLLSRTPKNIRGVLFSFGISAGSDMTAVNIKTDSCARPTFILKVRNEEREISLNLSGRHNVVNALAAAAAAYNAGAGLDAVKKGLESVRAVKGRLDILRTGEGFIVIDDTYNANPDSVAAALDALREIDAKGKKIFVMGEMLELGERARIFHREAGAYAVKAGVTSILTVGDIAAEAGLSAIKTGLKKENVHIFDTNRSAGEFLACIIKEGDAVLLKGSRMSRVEEIFGYLNLSGVMSKESY
ncbi:MAG: UDP-N-acetylmuramoyl-tripeptide--D-alanyl-D-alanine ligase [Candidatus Aureabacteria bacterium]|nr:UDP-N-acetylmuramoyl-tripeptide--D-alanyl-D-alanine ligase [Candidatus Auribacterota bacterium]